MILGPPRVALEPLFRVSVAGMTVGSFTSCTGLAASYETYVYEEGGNNLYVHTLRGRMKHDNLVLTGGVTDQSALLYWLMAGDSMPPPPVIVTFLNPDGTPLRRFAFANAMPVRWSGPSGNAGANAVATETLEVAHHGMLG